jgi:general secretion pathway protein G
MRRTRGFTLVEILIVVVLLAVLAAIVVPSIGNSATSARASSLAMNINLLRRFVVVYTGQHHEVPPGYPGGDRSAAPTEAAFIDHARLSSNADGQTAAPGTPGYPYGPYLSRIPKNPFNHLTTIRMLGAGEAFPAEATNETGWIYQPQTGEVRPNNTGTDDSGRRYYDY